jgi:putative membrane protein
MAEHSKSPDSAEGEDPRVRLAGERTLLAWVRTGLSMMGFGFVVARFGLFLREIAAVNKVVPARHTGLSLYFGIGLVALGVIVNVLAAWEHVRFLRRIDADLPYQPPRWSLSVVVAAALSAIGLAMAIYLVTLSSDD